MSQHRVETVVDGVTYVTMVDDAPAQVVKAATPSALDVATVVSLSPNSAPLTVNAGLGLNISPLALECGGNLDAIKEALDFIRDNQTSTTQKTQVANFPATQPVSGAFFQATQPVSGTFWQATQPVSAASLPLPTGAATDASLTNGNLRGSVSVSNLPASQPVTGTFFQAIQPISAAALPLPPNSAQEAYGNLDTIASTQEAALLASVDVGRSMLSTRGSDRIGALFSERGSR